MSIIFADGELTTGLNAGTTWANAFQGAAGLQSACDAAVAGDTLYVTRTFTLAAKIDIDTASGTESAPIRIIGHNYNSGDPIIDGTYAVLDANSVATSAVEGNNEDFWIWENVEFKNATTTNVYAVAECDYWTFVNCSSHHAGRGGVSGSGWGPNGLEDWDHPVFVLCKSYSNLENGFRPNNCVFFGCRSYSNGGHGFCAVGSLFNNCIAYLNAGSGFYLQGDNQKITNSVSDRNTAAGIYLGGSPEQIVACRITNNNIGLQGDGSALGFGCYNFLKGNTIEEQDCTIISYLKGKNTRITTGDDGYTDVSSGDYSLMASAVARRIEMQI